MKLPCFVESNGVAHEVVAAPQSQIDGAIVGGDKLEIRRRPRFAEGLLLDLHDAWQ